MAEREKTGTMIVTGGSRGIGAAVIAGAGASRLPDLFQLWRGCGGRRTRRRGCGRGQGGDPRPSRPIWAARTGSWRCLPPVTRAYGARPDVLINNAGITGKLTRVADMGGPGENYPGDEYQRARLIFLRRARGDPPDVDAHAAARGGSIVNVSLACRPRCSGGPGRVTCITGASKGATDTMTLGMSKEVGGRVASASTRCAPGPDRDGYPCAGRGRAGPGRSADEPGCVRWAAPAVRREVGAHHPVAGRAGFVLCQRRPA